MFYADMKGERTCNLDMFKCSLLFVCVCVCVCVRVTKCGQNKVHLLPFFWGLFWGEDQPRSRSRSKQKRHFDDDDDWLNWEREKEKERGNKRWKKLARAKELSLSWRGREGGRERNLEIDLRPNISTDQIIYKPCINEYVSVCVECVCVCVCVCVCACVLIKGGGWGGRGPTLIF